MTQPNSLKPCPVCDGEADQNQLKTLAWCLAGCLPAMTVRQWQSIKRPAATDGSALAEAYKARRRMMSEDLTEAEVRELERLCHPVDDALDALTTQKAAGATLKEVKVCGACGKHHLVEPEDGHAYTPRPPHPFDDLDEVYLTLALISDDLGLDEERDGAIYPAKPDVIYEAFKACLMKWHEDKPTPSASGAGMREAAWRDAATFALTRFAKMGETGLGVAVENTVINLRARLALTAAKAPADEAVCEVCGEPESYDAHRDRLTLNRHPFKPKAAPQADSAVREAALEAVDAIQRMGADEGSRLGVALKMLNDALAIPAKVSKPTQMELALRAVVKRFGLDEEGGAYLMNKARMDAYTARIVLLALPDAAFRANLPADGGK